MVKQISIAEYFDSFNSVPMVDVRSPGEYQKGHIPHAVNIALFSNEERAAVGTKYVQHSREEAIELGYTFVNPKLNDFLEASHELSGDGPIAVHCWRGGMRSQAFAEHLATNGFKEVYVIKRGYKAFRNHVLQFFEQVFKLRIIGGYTGSGKTKVLKALEEKGLQVIDLEGLANHKGSAFGAIGEHEQPSVEHFENCLFAAFHQLNTEQPIWIEDESINIGQVKMPKALFNQIRSQDVFFLKVPIEARIQYLVSEYAQFGNEVLAESILKISKRLGGQAVKDALSALEKNDYAEVARIALQYYDKAYSRGVSERNPNKVITVDLDSTNPVANAESLIQLTKT